MTPFFIRKPKEFLNERLAYFFGKSGIMVDLKVCLRKCVVCFRHGKFTTWFVRFMEREIIYICIKEYCENGDARREVKEL